MPSQFPSPVRQRRAKSSRLAKPRLEKPRLEDRLADEARFIKTWLDNPILTGAVSPSGRFLARMMARAVDPIGDGPIVELGPGTGPITEALLKRGVAPRRLVLVEFDGAFCRLLRKRFPGVHVVQGDAYRLDETLASVLPAPASAVVSSLPLLNRPDNERLALIADAFELMAPGGTFVQFTYGMASPVPRIAAAAYDAEVSPPIWLNLPPARVWIYRRKADIRADAIEVPSQDVGLCQRNGEPIFRPARFRPMGERKLFRRRRNDLAVPLED